MTRPRHPVPRVAGALAISIAAAFAGTAHAEAGRVEFVFGSGTVRNAQGVRPLVRGLDLESGDTVLTSDGRAHIRFKDGAYVSLQPNTEFAIRDYRFDGRTDGSERGVFGLAKGAVRAVTGLIGRVNRDSFKVVTPTATVGVRGTGGVLSILLDGSTLVRGTSGVWTLTNAAGTINVPAGVAARAGPDPATAPQQTSARPEAPPAPAASVAEVPIAKAEERTSTGTTSATGSDSSTATDLSKPIGVAYAQVRGGANSVQTAVVQGSSNPMFTSEVAGNIGTSGQLSGFTYKQTYQGTTTASEYRFNGTLLESGYDNVVGWGRWIGAAMIISHHGNGTATTIPDSYPANGGFHYVYGLPTAQMPTTGQFTYNLIGATGPTIKTAALPPGVVNTGQLIGTFSPGGGSISVNLGFGFNGNGYLLSAGGTITGSVFSGAGSVTGTGCTSGCGSTVQGGFFGTGATNAGMVYTADTAPGANQVSGVAVFRR
jgi:hypothetical protein